MDRVIGGRFRLRERIGAGSFGEIYAAENTRTGRRVAVKLEPLRAPAPQLAHESRVYALLAGGTGIARLHWFGARAGWLAGSRTDGFGDWNYWVRE
jgi:serine/threonine protein kinase